MKQAIREKAYETGFDAVGFCAAETPDSVKRDLKAYINDGRHGEMAWMADTLERRADPRTLWPDAKSVVVLGINYNPENTPFTSLPSSPDHGRVSVYAQGRDYHHEIKKRLKRLGRWMGETFDCDLKVFVDTAPVMEKPLAQAAGLGWQGKHTCLVSREFGSWLFLAEIFTTLDITPDEAAVDLCGSCTKCVDACPTGALDNPYRIDARRCISYLTIEHKGDIDAELADRMGGWIFGCDDCLAACPWNKFAGPAMNGAFTPNAKFANPRLADIVAMDDPTFRQFFAQTPIKRTGRDRIVRNALIAMTNLKRRN